MNVYIVTGAGKGIGHSISKLLSRSGKHVIKVVRNSLISEKSENEESYFLNLLDIDAIKGLFAYCSERMYIIEGIIHCAGICPVQRIEDITKEEIESVYRVNTFSFIELCRCFFIYPNRCPDARIIAVSSITSDRAYRNQLLYSSSKAALNHIVMSLAQEGISKDIKINVVQLGAVETDMFKSLNPNMQTISRHYPLGIMTVDEVAEIIVDLTTKKFRKMTGSIIRIDSGFNLVH